MKVSPIEVVLRASVAAACIATTCAAAPAPARHHAATRAHRASTHRAPTMRAVVDPATGQLTSSPRVSDAPGAAAPMAAPAPVPGTAGTAAAPGIRTLADGTRIVAVPADQMQYEVVRVGQDGKLVRACVHGDPTAATRPVKPVREER